MATMMVGDANWYEHHILAADASVAAAGDTEEVAGRLWAALSEQQQAPMDDELGSLASTVAAMPWNAHLLEPLTQHGFVPDQPFAPTPNPASLLSALNAIGAGANPMPFPRPEIAGCELLGSTPVMTDRGVHVFEHVLVVGSGRAYGFVRNLQNCIYGRVARAIELKLNPTYTTESAESRPRGGFFSSSLSQSKRRPETSNPRWYITDTQVAIKCIERQRYENHMQRHAGRLNEDPIKELAVMQYIGRHGGAPHVLPLLGCYANDVAVYAILPFCPHGDLFGLVEKSGRLDEPRAFAYFKQIMDGMEALHVLGLAHHDMSLENLMLDRSHSAIIIDFGMAVKVARSNSSSSSSGGVLPTRASTGWPCRCGKLLYMAPELFTPVHPVDVYAADLWACGIILFLLLTGMPPWDPGVGPTEADKRYQYVRDGRLAELLQVWHVDISTEATDLLQRMLTVQVSTRITIAGIHAHPWWVALNAQAGNV